MVVLTEPHPGTAHDLNRWYEEDHFYVPAMSGPGVMAGARFVATRECRAVRAGDGLFGSADSGVFLSLYWVLAGAQARWDEWRVEQEALLRADGRWDFPKDQLYAGVAEFAWESAAPDASPAIVALDRAYAGVIAIALRCEPEGDLSAVRAWSDSVVGSDMPVCVALRPDTVFKTINADEEAIRAGAFVFLVGFTEQPPTAVLPRVRASFGALDAPVGFVSAFHRLDPGSEKHLDDI